jgi:integrase-like protein
MSAVAFGRFRLARRFSFQESFFFRHTMAMELLQAGVDLAVIALWLGHESVETTQIYLDANLALKEEILAKTMPPEGRPGRYKADDELLAFLQHL